MTGYEIEADIFSGRENPVWRISLAEFQEFFRKVLNLEDAHQAPLFDGLGCRGFIISSEDGIILFVQKNIVKIINKGKTTYKCPTTSTINAVLDMAQAHLDEAIYNLIVEMCAA